MHVSLFKLAPKGSGISCDADRAFIGSVPLLKRGHEHGREVWAPRDHRELSRDLGACFGLPIDMESKAAGLAAIANALNAGNVARAQMLTLFLRFPDPATVLKAKTNRPEVFKFVAQLIEADFIKADLDSVNLTKFNPNHRPAGSPEGPGQFAPKGEGSSSSRDQDSVVGKKPANPIAQDGDADSALDSGVYHPDADQARIEQVADRRDPKRPQGAPPSASTEWKPDGIIDAILAAILGAPQNTTRKPLDPHAFASRVLAEHLRGRPGIKEVWYHSTLRTISKGAINSSRLPDVATVAEDGTITPYEILSPKQKLQDMYDKYNGIEARAGSGVRLAKVEVLTREAVWGLPEAAALAEESVTEGEAVEGIMRGEQTLNALNDSVDDEPE